MACILGPLYIKESKLSETVSCGSSFYSTMGEFLVSIMSPDQVSLPRWVVSVLFYL